MTLKLSIDRVLNKENKHQNKHQKLVPDPFLILVNNPTQSLQARNSFENKEEDYQKALKSELYFFFWTQSLLMDKVIKNKRDLELVTS